MNQRIFLAKVKVSRDARSVIYDRMSQISRPEVSKNAARFFLLKYFAQCRSYKHDTTLEIQSKVNISEKRVNSNNTRGRQRANAKAPSLGSARDAKTGYK